MKIYKLLFIIFTFLLLFNCQKKQPKTQEPAQVLATVGDKQITLAEFIRRAEYTIRPNYCNSDNYIHKKIILNSLITEKLFALEAGDSNRLTNNAEYQRYIQGRKEQAMRQQYFADEAVAEVVLDSSEFKREYNLAGRVYKVSYYSLPDKLGRKFITSRLSESENAFEKLFRKYIPEEELPTKEVKYGQPESPLIYDALFKADVKSGQVIGPLTVEDGKLFIMRVEGWTDSKVMSDFQAQDRSRLVREYMTQKKSMDIFETKVKKLMQGKKMDFNKPVFVAFTNAVGPDYFKSDDEKQEAFKKQFWEKDKQKMVLDDRENKLNEIRDQVIFTVDGQEWTVEYFEKMLQIHPLVFREKKFPQNQFGAQLRLAIADMIRDKYITEDAYEKGYDKHSDVIQNTAMWTDNLLSLYKRKDFLQQADLKDKSQIEIIEEYLDPQADSLRSKYSDRVSINTNLFEKIELTTVDMFVIQQNVPFPVIVPGFPQLTLHDKLDYGKKLETKK